MSKELKNKKISVFWEDAKIGLFKKGDSILLTRTKCEGELIKEDKNFIILRNCQQSVFDRQKKKFIFERKFNFFFIPKGMITKNSRIRPEINPKPLTKS